MDSETDNMDMEDPALGEALRAKASYHAAPADLRLKLREVLDAAPQPVLTPRRKPGFTLLGWLGASAAFAFGVVLAFSVALALGIGGKASNAALTDEIVASHVRSLMASHHMDVASTDQHTVKPWFNGKVDFSPPVTDTADLGYPLAGGRLDYLDRHPVAALVYRRHAHLINVFVWPEAGGEAAVTTASEQGYHVMQWREAGMRYAAVSDVNSDELRVFVDELKKRNA
jgi:anti-sigma factor RsiW